MITSTLQPGMTGNDVAQLQRALFEKHFAVDITDTYDAATVRAVKDFQHGHELKEDGIAGPVTLRALGLLADDATVDPGTGLSVYIVSEMCPGAPLVNIRMHLPNVIAALKAHDLCEPQMVLMAIATIRVETAGFVPISEMKSIYNTAPGGPPFGLYDRRLNLGNVGPDDGQTFRGRGFIQLTGRANYQKFGPKLQPPVDLLAAPVRANESAIAADLLCLFLNAHKADILTALAASPPDFATARKRVNGGSHGLKDFIVAYQTGAQYIPAQGNRLPARPGTTPQPAKTAAPR